jgi:ribosomal protein L23
MIAEEVILKPVLTEKSAIALEEGKYTFKVDTRATKIQIRKAVEELFNVKVLKVATLNYDGKSKRVRGIKGRTAKYKKAIVTIDLDPQEVSFKDKGGKTKKTLKKYNNEIEGFFNA